MSTMIQVTEPTMVLNEEVCKSNIARMAAKAKAANVVFRPHFKTHQSREIGEWFRASGVDKITVSSEGNDKIAALLDKNSDTVKAEVLATDIISGEIKGYSKEWNINGETVTLGVSKN